MDVWIEPTPENAARVWAALGAFGAPQHALNVEDLMKPGMVFQIGLAPIRIDILTAPSGLQFGPCWERSTVESIAGVPCRVLSKEDLIANKRAAGRHKDLDDLEKLDRQASNLHPDLFTVFPRATQQQKHRFDLLRRAYIDARYKRDYRITRKELEYLAERVRKLQRLTKKICRTEITRLGRARS